MAEPVQADERPQGHATRNQAAGALVLLVLILLGVFSLCMLQIAPQQWEYRVVDVKDADFPSQMRDIGAQGWELVTTRRASEGDITDLAPGAKPTFVTECVFKRRAGFGDD